MQNYINEGKVYFGGDIDKSELYVEPTILTDIIPNAKVMENEIFGPILPVIEFEDLNEVTDYVNERSKPLALYYFSEDRIKINYMLKYTTSGGVTINDTIIHVANGYLPFGGVGTSGIGKYHGKTSFDTFTHERAVMERGTFIEFNIRFAPYKDKLKLIKNIMK